MNLKLEYTSRGFPVVSFMDLYGVKCSIQKSSLATEDAVWIGVDDADPKVMASDAAKVGVKTSETTGWVPYPVPGCVLMTTRMHLTRGSVAELLPVLQQFAATGEVEAPDVTPREFYCYPCRGEELDPDDKSSMITECALEFADRIGVYRRNDLELNPEEDPCTWVFDIMLEGRCDRQRDMAIAEGLCELLNTLSPADAVNNPKLHALFV
jgi:hypothetical protein